jgi:hypothetical protein
MHEEVNYFPEIEKVTGQKGVMDGEVEQHGKNNQVTRTLQDPLMRATAAFHTDLKTFKDYLSSLKNPASEFSSERLLEIMDSFSEPLYAHLAAEPQALLALSRFASPDRQFDLIQIERDQGKKAVTLDFALNTLPIFMNNMELVEFESGMWKGHPAVPSIVRFIMKKVIPMWNWRLWRFMSCDGDGRRKRLVA